MTETIKPQTDTNQGKRKSTTERISQIETSATGLFGAAGGNSNHLQEQVHRYAWPCRGYIAAAMNFQQGFEDAAHDFIVNKLANGYIFERFVARRNDDEKAEASNENTSENRKPTDISDDKGEFRFYLKRSLRYHVNSALKPHGPTSVPLSDELFDEAFSGAEAEFDRLFLRSVVVEVLTEVINLNSVSGREIRWRVFSNYYLDGGVKWRDLDSANNLDDGQSANFGEAVLGQIRQRLLRHQDYDVVLQIYRESSAADRKLEIQVDEDDAFSLGLMSAMEQEFLESDLTDALKQFAEPTKARHRYEAIVAGIAKPEKLKKARKFFRIQLQQTLPQPRKLACEILVHAATARAEAEFAEELSTIPADQRHKRYGELASLYPGLRVTDWFRVVCD